MIREIVIWPDSILARVCERVPEVTDEVRRLLQDMEETMLWAKGSGLAAPQVGFALRLVTLLVKEKDERKVLKLVNPVIVSRRGDVRLVEGCLSLPGMKEIVRRSEWVAVEAQDENGQRIVVEGDGLVAHALQHELDHLDGKVFVDHVSPLKRDMVRRKLEKAKKRGMKYLPPAPAPQVFATDAA